MDPNTRLRTIFYAMIAVFLLIIAFFVVQSFADIGRKLFAVAAVLALIFVVLGVFLIVCARKEKGKLKTFLLLTSISAVAIPVCAILHNLVYALFILLFGEGFWRGGDEPVFFILGLIVCPVVFVIGAVGSAILLRKRRKRTALS